MKTMKWFFFLKVAHLISSDFSYIAKKELNIMLYNNMMILPLFTFPHISCGNIQMLCHSDKLISNGARTCFHLFTTWDQAVSQ